MTTNNNIPQFHGLAPSLLGMSFNDYPTSDGICMTVYFVGCEHHCEGCHNPKLQNIDNEELTWGLEEFKKYLKHICDRNHTNKIALEGGDPLHPRNRDFTKVLLDSMHEEYDFIVYTGYGYDSIKDYVNNAEYVKCGKFDKTKYVIPSKTDKYIQYASENQKLYKRGKLVSENGRYRYN